MARVSPLIGRTSHCIKPTCVRVHLLEILNFDATAGPGDPGFAGGLGCYGFTLIVWITRFRVKVQDRVSALIV